MRQNTRPHVRKKIRKRRRKLGKFERKSSPSVGKFQRWWRSNTYYTTVSHFSCTSKSELDRLRHVFHDFHVPKISRVVVSTDTAARISRFLCTLFIWNIILSTRNMWKIPPTLLFCTVLVSVKKWNKVRNQRWSVNLSGVDECQSCWGSNTYYAVQQLHTQCKSKSKLVRSCNVFYHFHHFHMPKIVHVML